MDLDIAADHLYVAPPANFVRRRNELAAEAQRAGDKTTAAEIKMLRKPTLGAWLANLLAHEHQDQIAELLRLGEMLQEAQLNLAGPEMRRLAQQRREIVGTLVVEARALAHDAGHPVGDDAARELETTLSAALADKAAGEELRRGHLTTALPYSGIGPLDQLSGTTRAPRVTPSPQPFPNKGVPSAADDHLRQRREAAERALRDAEAALSDAARVLEEFGDQVGQLQRKHHDRLSESTELEQRLQEAKAAAAACERELRRAEKDRRESERRVREATAQLERAKGALRRLPR